MRSPIISFYTEGYSEIVKDLISSLKSFGLSYDIEKRKDLSSWYQNVNFKADFILEKLKQYERIIWLDADAIVKRYPVYFDLIEEDIAVHYRNRKHLCAATIVLRSKPIVMDLVERWIEKIKEKPSDFDQLPLQNLLNDYQIENKLSVFYLPETYCYMPGISKLGEPVIYQTQASRKIRR